jgi:hypothetical protein
MLPSILFDLMLVPCTLRQAQGERKEHKPMKLKPFVLSLSKHERLKSRGDAFLLTTLMNPVFGVVNGEQKSLSTLAKPLPVPSSDESGCLISASIML